MYHWYDSETGRREPIGRCRGCGRDGMLWTIEATGVMVENRDDLGSLSMKIDLCRRCREHLFQTGRLWALWPDPCDPQSMADATAYFEKRRAERELAYFGKPVESMTRAELIKRLREYMWLAMEA